ncbi:MAG: Sir2 family NAD-dependent protein deacetylase [Actinocatenispora sp.]
MCPSPAGTSPGSRDPDLADVAGWLRGAERITVLTGAGVSTDSGIPDFRGPGGVWTRDPEAAKLVSLPDYVADPDVRRRAWLSRRDNPAWRATPNPAHHALVELARSGRYVTVLTQNIDGLHQRAGADPARVLELHGTLYEVECLSCPLRIPMREALDRVAAGEPDPACEHCGGILKSATVSFGQNLDETVLSRAAAAASEAEVFLAIGSSLTVNPAAGLVSVAAHGGARVIIINAEPTPYDPVAAARFADPIGEIVPALVRVTLGADR